MSFYLGKYIRKVKEKDFIWKIYEILLFKCQEYLQKFLKNNLKNRLRSDIVKQQYSGGPLNALNIPSCLKTNSSLSIQEIWYTKKIQISPSKFDSSALTFSNIQSGSWLSQNIYQTLCLLIGCRLQPSNAETEHILDPILNNHIVCRCFSISTNKDHQQYTQSLVVK